VREETGPRGRRATAPDRHALDAIAEHGFDACFGGARRDEERSRAKERILSIRVDFGQWDPRRQRPELWDLYNARMARGEHIRAFPLSNWTELDSVAVHRRGRRRAAEHLLRPTERRVVARAACSRRLPLGASLSTGEEPFTASVATARWAT
jgi:sulfate adenylyltransferase subunit 2